MLSQVFFIELHPEPPTIMHAASIVTMPFLIILFLSIIYFLFSSCVTQIAGDPVFDELV